MKKIDQSTIGERKIALGPLSKAEKEVGHQSITSELKIGDDDEKKNESKLHENNPKETNKDEESQKEKETNKQTQRLNLEAPMQEQK